MFTNDARQTCSYSSGPLTNPPNRHNLEREGEKHFRCPRLPAFGILMQGPFNCCCKSPGGERGRRGITVSVEPWHQTSLGGVYGIESGTFVISDCHSSPCAHIHSQQNCSDRTIICIVDGQRIACETENGRWYWSHSSMHRMRNDSSFVLHSIYAYRPRPPFSLSLDTVTGTVTNNARTCQGVRRRGLRGRRCIEARLTGLTVRRFRWGPPARHTDRGIVWPACLPAWAHQGAVINAIWVQSILIPHKPDTELQWLTCQAQAKREGRPADLTDLLSTIQAPDDIPSARATTACLAYRPDKNCGNGSRRT